jgi:precorrin-2 methylase
MKLINSYFAELATAVLFSILSISACNRCPATSAATSAEASRSSQAQPPKPDVDQITGATRPVSLGISGLVRQPVTFRLEDLEFYQPVTVRLNDVHKDRSFHGVHIYRGIPLRVLLEQAHVQKEESLFNRELDLAVVVRSQIGEEVLLSWGEIFYSNLADVIVAFSYHAKMPHKTCSSCHEKGEYEDRLAELERAVGLPKLVTARDQWSDRCIENITDIEVVELGRGVGIFLDKKDRPKELYSSKLEIWGPGFGPIAIEDVAGFQRYSADVVQAGDGTGYHGIKHYEGVSLTDVLKKAGIEFDAGSALVCSAPDGYRVLLSFGEVFLAPAGEGVMLADKLDGKAIEDGGKFRVVPTADFAADRWLKSVSRIDVVKTTQKPRLSIIGVGPGDTSLITLQAISSIARADVLVAPEDIVNRFGKYLGGKEILFDSLALSKDGKDVSLNDLSPEERKKKLHEARQKDTERIEEALKAGRTVAYLDYGDPTIFGTWRFLEQSGIPKDQIEFIPGISSVNAANAMLAGDATGSGALVITSPRGLEDNKDLAKSLAEGKETIAILVGLHDIDWTVGVLKQSFPLTTKITIVYKAGYAGSGEIVTTTLEKLKETVIERGEKHLGIIYLNLKP